MRVFYTKTALDYLDNLIEVLYFKDYFGFEAHAHGYVDILMDDVEATIHIKLKRKASDRFSRFGNDLYYATFPKNKRTTWYFFFTIHANDTYFIRYITNNHVSGHLIDL